MIKTLEVSGGEDIEECINKALINLQANPKFYKLIDIKYSAVELTHEDSLDLYDNISVLRTALIIYEEVK